MRPLLLVSSRSSAIAVPPGLGESLYLDEALATSLDETRAGIGVHPEQLACIVMTAGSSGLAKPVMIPHRSIVDLSRSVAAMVPFGCDELGARKRASASTFFLKELFAPLLAGVPQVFLESDPLQDGAAFVKEMEYWGVTRIHALPMQLDAILSCLGEQAIERLPNLRHILLGGEPCPAELLERAAAALPRCAVRTSYDTTEAGDIAYSSTEAKPSSAGVASIGWAAPNARVLVMDEELRRRPVGVIGEVYVETDAMSRGYWHAPSATAELFLANPYGSPGSRLHRTGDIGRRLCDGSVELLGRRHLEVEVRGHRVDRLHVERLLASHPGVSEAAVVTRAVGTGVPILIAYVVLKSHDSVSPASLRRHLSTLVPTYSVPASYEIISGLPRSPNGKLDCRSLPEPSACAGATERRAQSQTEKIVADLWSDVLAQPGTAPLPVRGADNFFDLGGHSLLANRVLARLRRDYGIEVRFDTLYEYPVLRDFAAAIEGELSQRKSGAAASDSAAGPPPRPAIIVSLAGGGDRLPKLFCVHPVGGQVHAYRPLAQALRDSARVYALQSESPQEFETLEALASFYGDEIRAVQPEGPYRLLGWSSGGLLALAIAGELERGGAAVDYVGLVDTRPIPAIALDRGRAPLVAATNILAGLRGRGFSASEVDEASAILRSRGWGCNVFEGGEGRAAIEQLARHFRISGMEGSSDYLLSRLKTTQYYTSLLAGFRPEILRPNVYVYQAAEKLEAERRDDTLCRWGQALGGDGRPAAVARVPGNHYSVMHRDNVGELGARVAEGLAALDGIVELAG
jgi:acyl-coenzyme A synthetase/AMP-(fatty) acid ligase/thioesterase domain-containing protein/aryl carrier-like protein